MTRNALKLTVEGELTMLDLDAEQGSLAVMQDAVGGWIEAADLADDLTMWLNEEGKLNGLDLNPIATAIWFNTIGVTDVIVGDVVFTGGTDEEGFTIGLSDKWEAAIRRVTGKAED